MVLIFIVLTQFLQNLLFGYSLKLSIYMLASSLLVQLNSRYSNLDKQKSPANAGFFASEQNKLRPRLFLFNLNPHVTRLSFFTDMVYCLHFVP